MRKGLVLFYTVVMLGLVGSGSNVWAATVPYNVINNSSDVTVVGSLPWCVFQANGTFGPDIINFFTSNSITVHTVLTIIDQVDIRGNSNSVGAHDGTGAGRQNCFAFAPGSDGSTITGLALVDSSTGIAFLSNHNHIANCHVGLDWAGTARNNIWGVYDQGQDNWIGGGPGDRNIISNNATAGILLANSLRCRIQGNYLGTNIAGNAGLGTQSVGIDLNPGVQALIGGNQLAGEGNVISGNTAYGIILENENSFGNTICGNVIGLTQDESTALPNQIDGLRIHRSSGNTIGLPLAGYQNVIAGNQTYNLIICSLSGLSPRPRMNIVQNNFIGVNSSSVAFATGSYNLYLNQADANLIGGNRDSLERNVISGAGSFGLYLIGRGNTVSGNYIGTDDGGNNARPNTAGIFLGSNVDGNLIGGENQVGNVRGNVISGNSVDGVFIDGGSNNVFQGNIIGLNAAGDAVLSNSRFGIYLGSGPDNTLIGGLSAGLRNVIAGNVNNGLNLLSASNHRIIGNYIGIGLSGTAFPNGNNSSIMLNTASDIRVENNHMARAVNIVNSAIGNTLVGNRIGVLPDGSPIAGLSAGVSVGGSSHNNWIGLPQTGQGNLIANTSVAGVYVDGAGTIGNGIFANTITASSGSGIVLSALGNGNKAAPGIAAADSSIAITGSALAGDYIEIFIAEGATGNGGSLRFVGYTTADGGGNWSLPANGLFVSGDYVCATATNSGNNTSGFSTNVLVVGPTPTFTATITPTLTPSPVLTSTPTATSTTTVTPTTALGSVDLGGKTLLAYPNPAQDQMTFLFHLDQAAEMKILIYNLTGERVVELSGDFAAGRGQTLVWDCGDAAPGVYLARCLMDGEVKETVKIAVIK